MLGCLFFDTDDVGSESEVVAIETRWLRGEDSAKTELRRRRDDSLRRRRTPPRWAVILLLQLTMIVDVFVHTTTSTT